MGSGASKSKNSEKSGNNSNFRSDQKPVANVNKPVNQKLNSGVDKKDSDKSSPSKFFWDSKKLEDGKSKDINANDIKNERNKNKKGKGKKTSINDYDSNIQFQEDSDIDDDIDEVLKMPAVYDTSKKKNKDYKQSKRNEENENFKMEHENEQDLPETYAQRLQRKQYKLQQDVLLREKTIIRNSKDWEEEEDEKNIIDSELESPQRFDASKFREVNKGDKKKTISTTLKDDFTTPRYLQYNNQSMDDIDTKYKDEIFLNKRTPQYDNEELDLMKQLEDELF